jgi:hypothetical protein
MRGKLYFMKHKRLIVTPSILPLCAALLLSGCASVGAGINLPIGPFSIGIGANNSGLSVGVGTSVGPVGVNVGVNPNGQVSAGAGLSASVPLGQGSAQVGGSTGTVILNPVKPR